MQDKLFKELVTSVREGGAILRGEVAPSRKFGVNKADVKRIRVNYRLSQGQFAALLGISVATLQNWEQGRRMPKGAARVLLQVAAKHPETVWDVVKPAVVQARTKAKGANRVARPERITLSTHPQFIALIERSRARQKAEGGISGAEMRRRLGVKKTPRGR